MSGGAGRARAPRRARGVPVSPAPSTARPICRRLPLMLAMSSTSSPRSPPRAPPRVGRPLPFSPGNRRRPPRPLDARRKAAQRPPGGCQRHTVARARRASQSTMQCRSSWCLQPSSRHSSPMREVLVADGALRLGGDVLGGEVDRRRRRRWHAPVAGDAAPPPPAAASRPKKW